MTNYHRACPECGTLVDDQGYCPDPSCRYCGKVPPFTIDRSLVSSAREMERLHRQETHDTTDPVGGQPG